MSHQPADPEQPELLPGVAGARAAVARSRRSGARRGATEVPLADVEPVAQVLVDVGPAHLDRTFDYAVPAAFDADARPGVRVKVRFAGQEVSGYLVARTSASDHTGRLTPLRRVVSAEPVLSSPVLALAGRLAERYAGTRADVLRLAVPPRHATTEKRESPAEPPVGSWSSDQARAAWAEHPAAAAYLTHLADGGAPHAVWSAPPGADWPLLLAHAAATAHAAGRGSIVCVPDLRDVDRLDAALTSVLGPGHHVVLTAGAGPSARYRRFLDVSRGAIRIAIGNRSAAFAPVQRLGLVACWDDGDDLLAEPRAPYPHAREVLLERAVIEQAAVLLGGFARSVEADQLVRSGWAADLAVPRETLRRRVQVAVAGATDHDRARDPAGAGARMPSQVRDVVRAGLEQGPVLVQTPRSGYAVALACERCRERARCRQCAGPLALRRATDPPACRWCGTAAPDWSCPECGGRSLRAPVLGEARTGEELGRAFPHVRVLTSAGDHVVARVDDAPAIVVATPGAEPVATDGYAAVVLLDTGLLLAHEGLRAAEEALRRWSNAAGLVRPGGHVLAVGDPAQPALQALVRWDHAGFARREADERRSARLPPSSRAATITGEPGAVDDALTLLQRPDPLDVLGPVPDGDGQERVVLRVPRRNGAGLAHALGDLQRLRASRKLDAVRVQLDPPSL